MILPGNQVRFLSLNCGRSSSRAGALPGPQPAGHQVRGRRHRRGRQKSRRVCFARGPDHSDRGIQEVKTKIYMQTNCTCQSEHFLLRTQQDLHHKWILKLFEYGQSQIWTALSDMTPKHTKTKTHGEPLSVSWSRDEPFPQREADWPRCGLPDHAPGGGQRDWTHAQSGFLAAVEGELLPLLCHLRSGPHPLVLRFRFLHSFNTPKQISDSS